MVLIVGIRLPSSNKTYYFHPGDLALREGDQVIVETESGEAFGLVVLAPQMVAQTMLVTPLKPVLRVATKEDQTRKDANEGRAEEALLIAQEKIEEHKLDMKLVDVNFSFDGSKITFYFTADERVDFRALVRDLARAFRARIELRQIGVRDEARMVGGIGNCGREVCCRAFMNDFHPVSIKMAKEQNLSLNPTKISGICGRLMCCLQYEQGTYEAIRRELPRVGREIYTPDGKGVVTKVAVIAEKIKVRITNAEDDSFVLNDYHLSEISEEHPVPPREKQPVISEIKDFAQEIEEAFGHNINRDQPPPTPRRSQPRNRNHPSRNQGAPRSRSAGRPAEQREGAERHPAAKPEEAPNRQRRRGRRGGAGRGKAPHPPGESAPNTAGREKNERPTGSRPSRPPHRPRRPKPPTDAPPANRPQE